uniref:Uncharacterized protein n=1 Tax=Candidatus Methanogaster sp. ANME-2c ERB4 TaxID=2759911 RepID=A0A7G9Y342_9EURY|nr:hypothetical protein PBILOLBF_00001 [Methanosarcinales archaeon ANME-2c ERB4]
MRQCRFERPSLRKPRTVKEPEPVFVKLREVRQSVVAAGVGVA